MARIAARAVIGGALVLAACGIDAVGLRESGSSPDADSGVIDATSSVDATSGDAATDAPVDAFVDARVEGGIPGDPPIAALPLDPKAACGRPSVYVDDFSDGIASPLFNATAPSGAIVEQNGTLVVAYGPGEAATYSAKAMVNLHEDRLRVAITTPPPPTGRAVVGLRIDDNRVLSFIVAGGMLNARMVDAGSGSNSLRPYDPVAHRWLQIVESGGTTKWETSPDGLTWTTVVSRSTPTFASTLRPFLTAGDESGAGPAGEARFARLNSGRPVGDWCKASSFSDQFEDGQISRFWEAFTNGVCTPVEANGELRFSIGAPIGECSWRSTVAYDLTGNGAYLEVPPITSYHPPVRFVLRVIDIASSGAAEIGFVGSNELVENATGLTPMATPYVGSSEDWWRLRESAGMVYWESSSDGTTWVEKRKAAVPFPVTAVKIAIGGEATAQMAGSVSIGTPRFNLGP